MKNKKKLFIIIPIIIAALVFVGVYFYYNYEDNATKLTAGDKKWLNDNNEKVIDFEVLNNLPVYGLNGEGVFFSFLSDLEEDTGMEFNKIPYLKENNPSSKSYRIRILSNEEKLTNKDLLIFEDGYVAIGTRTIKLNEPKDFSNYTIGVLSKDSAEVMYYLKSGVEATFKTYASETDLFNDLNVDKVDLVIVPYIMSLSNTIGKENYHINYYFTEYSNKVVLTLSDTENRLNNIVKKYFLNWKEKKYVEKYNSYLLDYYISERVINDKTKTDLLSKNYVYGFVENVPYEITIDDVLGGIAGEYISRMQRLTDIDFTYRKYRNQDELVKAIKKGDVDIYLDYFNYSDSKFLPTTSTFVEKYVVLKKVRNNEVVDSFESLKGKTISMLNTNSLYNYFKDNARVNIEESNNLSKLLSKAKDNLVVLDSEVYNYYKNTKLANYEAIYSDFMTNDYKFMVKSDNKNFYDLFNYIITTNSYYKYRNTGIINMKTSILDRKTFEETYLIVLALVFTPLFLIVISYFIIKNRRRMKLMRKEDRKRYTDMLTSLKNRNYLKLKIKEWDDSKVYPQAIMIIDLNNVKYVNTNYGHDKGDDLIVKAASILVNNQLENSEIIRTDGNEFLIYMVGYSENQVATYGKKLSKELKELPYGFGAALGYSMITDDIKTIDDAICEATLEMRTDKESYK